MADLVLANFVKETTTTTGTGTYSLAGAATGHQGFVAGVGGGSKVPYFVTDGTNWEHGLGTVTDAATDTISRDKIYASSNSGNAVNWSAGTRDIYVAESAHRPRPIHTITGNTTLGYAQNVVLCNSSSAFTVTLPAAADWEGKEYTITNINTGKVTIDGNLTETIRDPKFGSAETFDLWVIYDSVTIVSDGSAWYVTKKNLVPHVAHLTRDAAQAIANNTLVQIDFDTVQECVGASYDLAQTSEILINRTGNYLIAAQIAFIVDDGEWVNIQVLDGSGNDLLFNRAFSSQATSTPYINPSAVRRITATTRVGMKVRHTQGASQDTVTSAINRPYLCISEII
jgi:hypothetical protein